MKKGHWLALGFLLGLLAAAILILVIRRPAAKPLTLIDLPTVSPTTQAEQKPDTISFISAGQKLDLNQASFEQLLELPGIGETKAKAILTWREEHGPFLSLRDLLQVPGIGPALLEQLSPFLSISP